MKQVKTYMLFNNCDRNACDKILGNFIESEGMKAMLDESSGEPFYCEPVFNKSLSYAYDSYGSLHVWAFIGTPSAPLSIGGNDIGCEPWRGIYRASLKQLGEQLAAACQPQTSFIAAASSPLPNQPPFLAQPVSWQSQGIPISQSPPVNVYQQQTISRVPDSFQPRFAFPMGVRSMPDPTLDKFAFLSVAIGIVSLLFSFFISFTVGAILSIFGFIMASTGMRSTRKRVAAASMFMLCVSLLIGVLRLSGVL